MSFIESPRFPDEIAFWAVGGRAFKTTVVQTYGGDEFRNAAWSQMRGEFEVQNAFRTANQNDNNHNISLYLSFFRVCMGQLYGFRFKDFQDYTDSMNGGSGIFYMLTATTFQLYKRYTQGSINFDQIVQKPVSASVVVTGGVSPVVDYTTGIVTVSSGTPTSWTGQYDIPCRFAEDNPRLGMDESSGALYNWQQLKLIEIRDIS
jgi:uncharacterized protein (TIGR02217 family)